MDLKLTGKVVQILQEQNGEGRNGPWRKQEFVLETAGQYPKQVCIVQWGDNIDQFGIQEGETLTASIDIQSREYNGRWYTDVKAWRIDRGQAEGGAPQASSEEPWPTSAPPESSDDGLPF